jgi:hypothetical protein
MYQVAALLLCSLFHVRLLYVLDSFLWLIEFTSSLQLVKHRRFLCDLSLACPFSFPRFLEVVPKGSTQRLPYFCVLIALLLLVLFTLGTRSPVRFA